MLNSRRLLKKLADDLGNIIKTSERPVRLMFQDEARFGRISSQKTCWAVKGVRPVAPSQIVREYTYAFAAVSPHDGVNDTLILPWVDSELMSLFLAFVSARHPDEHIVMVMDGAAWHTANSLVVPAHMTVILLPPYSPELNPVEVYWKEVRKEGFYNCAFNSMNAVEDQLVTTLRHFENTPQRIQSFAGFEWIINIPLSRN
jgi:transposase